MIPPFSNNCDKKVTFLLQNLSKYVAVTLIFNVYVIQQKTEIILEN